VESTDTTFGARHQDARLPVGPERAAHLLMALSHRRWRLGLDTKPRKTDAAALLLPPAGLEGRRIDELERAKPRERPVHQKHLDREIGLDMGLA
jgi:hypothetical protein